MRITIRDIDYWYENSFFILVMFILLKIMLRPGCLLSNCSSVQFLLNLLLLSEALRLALGLS